MHRICFLKLNVFNFNYLDIILTDDQADGVLGVDNVNRVKEEAFQVVVCENMPSDRHLAIEVRNEFETQKNGIINVIF